MSFITNITQKGQVTIPKEVRKKLNLKPKDPVSVKLKNGTATIKKVETILDLAGTIIPRANKDKDPLEAREFMENNYERV